MVSAFWIGGAFALVTVDHFKALVLLKNGWWFVLAGDNRRNDLPGKPFAGKEIVSESLELLESFSGLGGNSTYP